jgi:hypothetical protein
MKKITAVFASVTLTLSLSACAFAVKQEVSVNAAYGKATIDGILDNTYLKSGLISVSTFGNLANNGTEANIPTMAKGEGYLLWDESNLYYFFSGKDSTRIVTSFESGSTDAIEMGLDFDNTNSEEARPASYGDNGLFLKAAPYAKALGYTEGEVLWVDGFSAWSEELREDAGYKVATTVNSTGYTVEGKIPLNDAVKAMFKQGYSFGYAISLLDDVDDDGMRDIKITWGRNDGDIQAANMLNTSASCDKVVLVK